MRRMVSSIAAAAVVLAASGWAATARADATGDAAVQAQVGGWVGGYGYPSRDAGGGIWILQAKGAAGRDIQILMAAKEGFVLAGSVVETKAHFRLSQALAERLLRLDNNLDFIKIVIDEDGDLSIRAELSPRGLTAPVLKDAIERVIIADGKVRDQIGADRIP